MLVPKLQDFFRIPDFSAEITIQQARLLFKYFKGLHHVIFRISTTKMIFQNLKFNEKFQTFKDLP